MLTVHLLFLLVTCFALHVAPFSIQSTSAVKFGLTNKASLKSNHFQVKRDPLLAIRPSSRLQKRSQFGNDNPITGLLKGFLPDLSVQTFKSATGGIILTNAAISLAAMQIPELRGALMKVDSRIWRGEWWRLLTSLFVHGGATHLVMSSYTLLNSGRQSEKLFGWPKFLAIYLGAGVIGNAISLLLGTAPQSLGSSGATYGLMGALGAFYFVNKNHLGSASAQALNGIKTNLMTSVGYAAMGGVQGLSHSISNMFGVVGGFMVAYFLVPGVPKSMKSQQQRRVPSGARRLRFS